LTKSKDNHVIPALIIGSNYINSLGVIRSLGRHGIPAISLSFNHHNIVRYSRYTNNTLTCPDPVISETGFIDFLLNQAKKSGGKCVLIPTNDATVLTLAKNKKRLEEYYTLLLSDFDIIHQLVNKSRFYRLLTQLHIPHPKTYFPADVSEIKSIGMEIGYPYIIKPALMHIFDAEFDIKCFVINSLDDLNTAVERLKNKNIEVVIQEIIPGNELYSLQAYFNKKSEPIAICGYDKLRQEPPDFGIGLLWKSATKAQPMKSAVEVLCAIKYYGIAESEFKKDPRDGQYKFLEINARTVVPSALPATCGVDISYIAYKDSLGQYHGSPPSSRNNVLWISELENLRFYIKQIRKITLFIKDILVFFKYKKVYAIFAWDDPLPLLFVIIERIGFFIRKYIFRKTINQL
jgi:D-aspartate ligase